MIGDGKHAPGSPKPSGTTTTPGGNTVHTTPRPLNSERLARRLGVAVMVLLAVVVALAVYTVVAVRAERNRAIHDVQRQIDQLACLIVAPYPDSTAPIISFVRQKYGCAPYDPRSRQLYTPSPTPSPTRSTTPARPTKTPSPRPRTSTVVVPPRVDTATRTVVRTRTRAGPVHTRTVTKPAPAPTVCVAPGVCITLPAAR